MTAQTSLRQLCKPSDDGSYYEKAVAELQDQFDKPRTMHGVYLEDVLKIGPVKPTRASLLTCASTLSDSLDGLNRLKQTDVYSILTSIAVGFLPEKLRMAWEEKTEDNREVPSVVELIAFLRKRAAMPHYGEKTSSHHATDRKPFKQQQSRHKASVHVALSQPPQQPEQQATKSSGIPEACHPNTRTSSLTPSSTPALDAVRATMLSAANCSKRNLLLRGRSG